MQLVELILKIKSVNQIVIKPIFDVGDIEIDEIMEEYGSKFAKIKRKMHIVCSLTNLTFFKKLFPHLSVSTTRRMNPYLAESDHKFFNFTPSDEQTFWWFG